MPDVELEEGVLDVNSFYKPWPKQDELHVSQSPFLLAIGGNGSGKSAFLLGEALYICAEYPGAHVLLLRKSFKELEKGLIQDFLNTVPKDLYKWNDQKKIATFFNGAKLFFGYCKSGSEKDLAQYLSSAFVWIGFDELGQFSYEAWAFMSSRNRVNKGCHRNSEGNMPYCRMGGASNPLGPGYAWIRKLWIQKQPVSQLGKYERNEKDGVYYQETHGGKIPIYDGRLFHFVHSTVLDNPAMLEQDPNYISKLMMLPPALRQKALYGDLNSIAGVYFQNFTQDRHVLSLPRDRDRIRWEPWQKVWISIDWGLAHHCVIYWHTRCKLRSRFPNEKGQYVWKPGVVTFRELIVNEKSHREIARDISDEIPTSDLTRDPLRGDERIRTKFIFLSPERFARVDDPDAAHTVAAEMGEVLKELHLPRPTRAHARRVDGAVFMYNLLDADEWMILDTCPELISSLETRVREEKDLEDVMKVEDLGDDCYDAARYGIVTMLSDKSKPEEVKFQERVAQIEDPVARRIYAYEHWLKEQKKQQSDTKTFTPRFSRYRKP